MEKEKYAWYQNENAYTNAEIKIQGDYDTFWVMMYNGFDWIKLPPSKTLKEAHELERQLRQFLYHQRKTFINKVLNEAIESLEKQII